MSRHDPPSKIRLALPLVNRRWIVPSDPREAGNAVLLVALAITFLALWGPVGDRVVTLGHSTAMAERAGQAPHRGEIRERLVGVYVFRDETGQPVPVTGRRVRLQPGDVPPRARAAWPAGRPFEARVIGEYDDRLFALPVGLALAAAGFWARARARRGRTAAS